MSNKPQPPTKDVLNRTTYIIQYEIDGVRYLEKRSLDVANGNFLAPLGITRINENQGFIGLGQDLYTEIDPNSEEGNKVLNSVTRNEKLKDFAELWAFKDDETFNAAVESGYIDQARGASSFLNEENVPFTVKNDEQINDELDAANELAIQEFNKSTQVKNEELYYPIDMITEVTDSQDFIYIEQYSYQPPQPVGTNKPSDVIKTGVTRGQNINREERHGGCKLPIPNKLGVSNGVNWGEAKANAVELAAFDTARGGVQTALAKPGEILNVITGGLKETGQTLQNLRGEIKAANANPNNINSGTILSGVLARSALGSIGINVDIDQFITRQTGAAINPNLELLFGGPQLRSFNFDFNFAPNSDREAVMVRKIQRWFKQGMLPSRSRATATSESSLFLASPNVFRITYKNNKRRIKGLNTFKICALTSVQIDFTPDGVYQSYEDSSAISMPVRSTMGLSFTELTPIFRDDYAPFTDDPSMIDAGLSVSGANSITDDDIGF